MLLDFDDGRSSVLRVSTFNSYGLNASGRVSCGDVFDRGVFDMVDGDFDDVSDDFLPLSIDPDEGLIAAVSAPI